VVLNEWVAGEPMKQYVEEQVMRADQKRRDKDQLEQLLINSLNSGDPIEITREMIEGVRRKLERALKGARQLNLKNGAISGAPPRVA
jgi:ribosome-associated translation inhibitor RaiA